MYKRQIEDKYVSELKTDSLITLPCADPWYPFVAQVQTVEPKVNAAATQKKAEKRKAATPSVAKKARSQARSSVDVVPLDVNGEALSEAVSDGVHDLDLKDGTDAAATQPCAHVKHPYNLTSDVFELVPRVEDSAMTSGIAERVTDRCLAQLFARHASALNSITVGAAMDTTPVVWQARTGESSFEPGEIVLVPWTQSRSVSESEGASTRPRVVHPHLPHCVKIMVGSDKLAGFDVTEVNSPLIAASASCARGEVDMVPCWAVNEEREAGHANMEERLVTMVLGVPSFVPELGTASAKKTRRALQQAPLEVRVPVLVNSKAIAPGSVLVRTQSALEALKTNVVE